MGAFYLFPKDVALSDKVLQIFMKKGFTDPLSIQCGKHNLLLYKKQLLNEYAIYEKDDDFIISVGTCFYKGSDYWESLKNILEDFILNGIDSDKLKGNYILLIKRRDRLFYCVDPLGVQNVFFNDELGIISSSFLAVLAGVSENIGKQRINRLAVTEVLITGSLVGPDTLVNCIKRYEPSLAMKLPGLAEINEPSRRSEDPKTSRTKDAEIENQLNVLHEYFKDIGPFVEEYGSVCGLTGGFDSRLLFLLLRNHATRYSLYSTSRKKNAAEFLCANKFAEAAGEPLEYINQADTDAVDAEAFPIRFRRQFYFHDGLVRTHQIWFEDIKGREFYLNLYKKYMIGLSGVGGEQYRNPYYLTRKKYAIDKWIMVELIFKNCWNPFLKGKHADITVNYIKQKIRGILGPGVAENAISLLDTKRYYNEIWNGANRTIRNNVENQVAFFLSPFAEWRIVKNSYSAFPHLGGGTDFEREMIKKLAPELSLVMIDHGLSIAARPPLKMRVLPLMKKLLGLRIFNYLIYRMKNRESDQLSYLLAKYPGLAKYVSRVEKLDLPLNLPKLIKSASLAPLVIEMGLFLDEMSECLENA